MGELNSFGQAYFGQVSALPLWAIPVPQRQVTRLRPARSWNGNSSACSCLFFKQHPKRPTSTLVKRTGEIFPKTSKNDTHDLETCAKPHKHRARSDLVPLPSDYRPVADVDQVDGVQLLDITGNPGNPDRPRQGRRTRRHLPCTQGASG